MQEVHLGIHHKRTHLVGQMSGTMSRHSGRKLVELRWSAKIYPMMIIVTLGVKAMNHCELVQVDLSIRSNGKLEGRVRNPLDKDECDIVGTLKIVAARAVAFALQRFLCSLLIHIQKVSH